jgi:hypothetical protein
VRKGRPLPRRAPTRSRVVDVARVKRPPQLCGFGPAHHKVAPPLLTLLTEEPHYGLLTGLRRYLVARPGDDPLSAPLRLYVVENISSAEGHWPQATAPIFDSTSRAMRQSITSMAGIEGARDQG